MECAQQRALRRCAGLCSGAVQDCAAARCRTVRWRCAGLCSGIVRDCAAARCRIVQRRCAELCGGVVQDYAAALCRTVRRRCAGLRSGIVQDCAAARCGIARRRGAGLCGSSEISVTSVMKAQAPRNRRTQPRKLSYPIISSSAWPRYSLPPLPLRPIKRRLKAALSALPRSG